MNRNEIDPMCKDIGPWADSNVVWRIGSRHVWIDYGHQEWMIYLLPSLIFDNGGDGKGLLMCFLNVFVSISWEKKHDHQD